MSKAGFIPQKLRPWIEARKRHNLSHAQIQMARELGLKPKKLGRIANHEQQPWKLPLPQFIEERYRKQFGKKMPEDVQSVEMKVAKSRVRKYAKRSERQISKDEFATDQRHGDDG